MLIAMVKGALGAALLLVAWVATERAWRRFFKAELADPGRSACRECIVCSRRCRDDHEQSEANAPPAGALETGELRASRLGRTACS